MVMGEIESKRAVVSILGQNKRSCGTGFLVGKHHILTCAHVVGAALGDDKRYLIARHKSPPTDPIHIRFFLKTNGRSFIITEVEEWSPYIGLTEAGEEAVDETDTALDFALLRIAEVEKIPPETKPVRFWAPPEDASMALGLPLTAVGFANFGDGFCEKVALSYVDFSNEGTFRFTQQKSDWTQEKLKGISGGPICITDTNIVIAITSNVTSRTQNLVVGRPAESIRNFWNRIRSVLHGKELEHMSSTVSAERRIPSYRLNDIDRITEWNTICDQIGADMGVTHPQPRPLVHLIAGHEQDWIKEWIIHLIVEDIQRIKGMEPWTKEASRPPSILMNTSPRNPRNNLPRTMADFAKQLGLTNVSFEGLVDRIRALFNHDWKGASAENAIPPSTYHFFYMSIPRVRLDGIEARVVKEFLEFWKELANEELAHYHLVFVVLTSKPIGDCVTVQRRLADITKDAEIIAKDFYNVQVHGPLPSPVQADMEAWTEFLCTASQGPSDQPWSLDLDAKESMDSTLNDIFEYEVDDGYLTLEDFHQHLHGLDLCQCTTNR